MASAASGPPSRAQRRSPGSGPDERRRAARRRPPDHRRDAATRDARIPVGFLAAITRGLQGEQLTEMAELREQGALGFTDDGLPVRSAGVLRKALQYQRLAGGVLALHEEDPTLSRGGSMHEGRVSAALGIRGIPTVSESTMVARDAALAGYEDGRVHFQHVSCAASVDTIAAAK